MKKAVEILKVTGRMLLLGKKAFDQELMNEAGVSFEHHVL